MLARHAENLFWGGRYLERAEDTAVLLDVTYHGLLQSPLADAAAVWRELLEVLYLDQVFFATHGEFGGNKVTDFLVLDHKNPGSIVAAVARARENARNVREQISTDLWEAVNTLYLELQARNLKQDLEGEPYELYRWVKSRCQTISGVAAETMPRDDGWRFFTLGRMLERAEMTCRLLGVRFAPGESGPPVAFHHWVAVLSSVSAFEAYVKAHKGALDPAQVLDFLLLSREFPRSVLVCLQVAERQLARLAPPDTSIAPLRRLSRVRADLEYRERHELDDTLTAFLSRLQDDIRQVANAVGAHFFRSEISPELRALRAA
jgi:uncharacterized alpha-E superfamily protein